MPREGSQKDTRAERVSVTALLTIIPRRAGPDQMHYANPRETYFAESLNRRRRWYNLDDIPHESVSSYASVRGISGLPVILRKIGPSHHR